MATITGFGGFREVGRSAVFIETNKEKFIFDFGIDVQEGEMPLMPKDVNWAPKLNGVFVTHAHLDHSGGVPWLYKKGYQGNTYTTPLTLDLCSILLRDSIKVQEKKGETPFYLPHDIESMENKTIATGYNKEIPFPESKVTLKDAGHVPGSALTILESNGKKILYTGDIKFIETELLRGAKTKYSDIDVVICESTYSSADHPERKKLTDDLKEKIKETYNNNGIILLPCFAVGRTQEMLCITEDMEMPVHVDGMGIAATKAIIMNPDYVKDPERLKKAFGKAYKISNNGERHRAIKNPGIIITTAGMLNGGPINFYIKKLRKKEETSLILTGYQCQNTVGRKLLETGHYVNDTMDFKPSFNTHFMDFSAHTDRSHIISFLKKTNPEKVILVHGERNPEFAVELQGMGFDAKAPSNLETIEV